MKHCDKLRRQRGFTLVELLTVVVIIAILALISILAYGSYVDKARLTVSISTLQTLRTSLEDYHIEYQTYPADIDFSTGKDDLDRIVFGTSFVSQLNQDLFAIDTYNSTGLGYTILARANNRQHTVLKMVPEITVVQE